MILYLILVAGLIVTTFFALSYRKAQKETDTRLQGIIADLRRKLGRLEREYSDVYQKHEDKDALALDAIRVLGEFVDGFKDATRRDDGRHIMDERALMVNVQPVIDFLNQVPTRTTAKHFREKNYIIRQIAIDKKLQPDVLEACREMVELNQV